MENFATRVKLWSAAERDSSVGVKLIPGSPLTENPCLGGKEISRIGLENAVG